VVVAALAHLVGLGQATDEFARPAVDWHALAPDLVVVGALCAVLLADLFLPEDRKGVLPSLAGLGLLGALVPVLTLTIDGADRTMFGGAYAVDNFALVLKGLFLVAGYVVVLLSTNYIAEGDYAEGEYYVLLLSSILGMTVIASARDLVTIFVALELLSIPAYLLAGWRKLDPKGNEAGAKYYLVGVFATAVLLYGMSLLYGVAGSTLLSDIGAALAAGESLPVVTLAIVFVVAGFAFKVSAVPFHTWAPDTYEGAPTPITAFLSVSSKAAGFVALVELILIAFQGRTDVVEPLVWALAVLSMTIGNVVALRQTNVVRMLAYSGISQAGFILAPLAVVADNGDSALRSVVTYLLIYAAMNLGAFTVVMAVARKTGSGEVTSFGGRAHDGLPVRPGRHPAAGGLAGQVRRLPGRDRRRHPCGLRAGRGHGRQLRDRAGVLRQRGPGDVDEPAARRGSDPRARAGLAHRRPGHHRRAHPRVRGHPLGHLAGRRGRVRRHRRPLTRCPRRPPSLPRNVGVRRAPAGAGSWLLAVRLSQVSGSGCGCWATSSVSGTGSVCSGGFLGRGVVAGQPVPVSGAGLVAGRGR